MQLVAPDLFAEVSRLSVGACIIGVVLGSLIWATGWWQHRFWVVAFISAAAGILGLQQARSVGVQPLVAGFLGAVAAGLMAMELAKVLAFLGGGAVLSLLSQTFLPNVREPLIAFLAGGLAGIVLFRMWMIVLTAALGASIAVYCSLALGRHWLKADITGLVSGRPGTLNLVVVGITLLGVLVQAKWDKWVAGIGERRKSKVMKSLSDAERDALKSVKSPGPLSRLFRTKKAG